MNANERNKQTETSSVKVQPAPVLTEIQRQALYAMSARNVGAVHVNGIWIWPEMVRRSETLAQQVIDHYRRTERGAA